MPTGYLNPLLKNGQVISSAHFPASPLGAGLSLRVLDPTNLVFLIQLGLTYCTGGETHYWGISCRHGLRLYPRVLGLMVCNITLNLCGAGSETRGSEHTRQAHGQLNDTLSG